MARKSSGAEDTRCPCGSGAEHAECCAPYISGARLPKTPEQLMRSRYCGFVQCNEAYLLETWHPDTRPSRVRFDDKQRWLGLKIKSAAGDKVEFVARYKLEGCGHRLHETSRFEQIEGRWYYLDGQHH